MRGSFRGGYGIVIYMSRKVRSSGNAFVYRCSGSMNASAFKRGVLTNYNGCLRGLIEGHLNMGTHSMRLGIDRHYSTSVVSTASRRRTVGTKRFNMRTTLGNRAKGVVSFVHGRASSKACVVRYNLRSIGTVYGRRGAIPSR